MEKNMFENSILSIESELAYEIGIRVKKLRGKTPVSNITAQRTVLYNIEKGEIPEKGNFISDVMLDDLSTFFKIKKKYLIFGDDNDIEYLLQKIFFTIAIDAIYQKNEFSNEVSNAVLKLFTIFADFNRYYKIRRSQDGNNIDQEIDFVSMFKIIWKLIKNKIISSYKNEVISELFDDDDNDDNDKIFYFNQMNKKFEIWYRKEFSRNIVPNFLESLKKNSIFKIGFIVNNLIDEHLVTDIPQSYLHEIPLEEFYFPNKTITFNGGELTEDGIEEMFKFFHDANELNEENTIDALKKWDEKNYFENIDTIDYHSTPFINDSSRVDIKDFLNKILETPTIFDSIHKLNLINRKIPGLLTVNSQASNVFQEKLNKIVLTQIDDLVRFQNIYINLIKWEELENFL